jgi:hypothetical protein
MLCNENGERVHAQLFILQRVKILNFNPVNNGISLDFSEKRVICLNKSNTVEIYNVPTELLGILLLALQ